MVAFDKYSFKSITMKKTNGEQLTCNKHIVLPKDNINFAYSLKYPFTNEIIDLDFNNRKIVYLVYACEQLTADYTACWGCIHQSFIDSSGLVTSKGSHDFDYWLNGNGRKEIERSVHVLEHPHSLTSRQILNMLYPCKIITPEEAALSPLDLIRHIINKSITQEYHELFKSFCDFNWAGEFEITGIHKDTLLELVRNMTGYSSDITHKQFLNESSYMDLKKRKWSVVTDNSIRAETPTGSPTSDINYKCELVTPILNGIEDLQLIVSIIQELNKHHIRVNDSCSVHIHVSSCNGISAASLRNLLCLIYSYQDLLYTSVHTFSTRKNRYCKPLPEKLLLAILDTTISNTTQKSIQDAWYSSFQDMNLTDHYNKSRYSIVNLHSYFQNKGIEFRFFNGTTNVNEILAYILLSIALLKAAENASEISCMHAAGQLPRKNMEELLDGIGITAHLFTLPYREILLQHLGSASVAA